MADGVAKETGGRRVAIVGAGPCGFYAAQLLQRADLAPEIDLFERLPVPYGLVRYGVAPDAQKTKLVTRALDKVAAHPGFRFFGNVRVGEDVSVHELRRHYDAVLFAHGSETHRRLGIEGEAHPNCLTANRFTGWYNGHPDCADAEMDLSAASVAVVGNGNVAMDVCRILAKSPAELAVTDVPAPVVDALAASGVRDIHVLARRGPVQAAFTHVELQQLAELEEAVPIVRAEDLELEAASERELAEAAGHERIRNLELLRLWAEATGREAKKRIHFHFRRSPTAFDGRALTVERNRLTGEPGHQRAEGTGLTESMPCGLVVKCIGYRSVPIPGLPFDEGHGVVPNRDGRVLSGAKVLQGVYAAGWVRHGPTGLVGTSKRDAQEVARLVLEDLSGLPVREVTDREALPRDLAERGVRVISFEGWQRIDRLEVERGRALGKPREKICRVEDLLAAANVKITAEPQMDTDGHR